MTLDAPCKVDDLRDEYGSAPRDGGSETVLDALTGPFGRVLDSDSVAGMIERLRATSARLTGSVQ